MTKVPDRLCAESSSPFFVKDHPLVRVSVDGVEFTGAVLEYCISKGWAKIIRTDPKTGNPIQSVRGGRVSVKMRHGIVQVWLASDPIPPGAILPGSATPTEQHVIADSGA